MPEFPQKHKIEIGIHYLKGLKLQYEPLADDMSPLDSYLDPFLPETVGLSRLSALSLIRTEVGFSPLRLPVTAEIWGF